MKMLTTILLTLPLVLPAIAARDVGTPAPVTAALESATIPLSSLERDVLAAAERASTQELVELRGGDLSNSDLMTILLVLGIVVLIVLLL